MKSKIGRDYRHNITLHRLLLLLYELLSSYVSVQGIVSSFDFTIFLILFLFALCVASRDNVLARR